MLDLTATIWLDQCWSAEAGEAPPRSGEPRLVRASRANPIFYRVQETNELNDTAGG